MCVCVCLGPPLLNKYLSSSSSHVTQASDFFNGETTTAHITVVGLTVGGVRGGEGRGVSEK